jgi:RNA polymerase sigma-70 factor (ECF subfamily)
MNADILIAQAQTYRGLLMSRALGMTKNFAEAEDIVADTMLQAFRKADRWDPLKGKLVSWLCTLLKHSFYDRYRRGTRTVPTLDVDAFTPDQANAVEELNGSPGQERQDPLAQLCEEGGHQTVLLAINRLPPTYRVILELNIENLTYQEISDRLSIKLGTVRSRMNRMRKRLRQILERERIQENERLSNHNPRRVP